MVVMRVKDSLIGTRAVGERLTETTGHICGGHVEFLRDRVQMRVSPSLHIFFAHSISHAAHLTSTSSHTVCNSSSMTEKGGNDM